MESLLKYNLRDTNIIGVGAPNKGITPRLSVDNFAETVRSVLADALKSDTITAKQLGYALGKHPSTIYRYAEKDGCTNIPSAELLMLIRVLAEHGNTELLSLIIPTGYTISKLPDAPLNGEIKDEFVSAVTSESDAERYFEQGKFVKALGCVKQAETVVLKMDCEIEVARGARK